MMSKREGIQTLRTKTYLRERLNSLLESLLRPQNHLFVRCFSFNSLFRGERLSFALSRARNDKQTDLNRKREGISEFLWFVCKLFHYKDRSIIFLDLCSNRDSDFWERILSLKSHVSLFYLLFYLLFYVQVVVVVHQGNCWEEVEVHRQRPGSLVF